MLSRVIVLLFVLVNVAGCDSEPTGPSCVALTDGPWILNGTSIGHDMFGTLVFDEATCSFTFSDWSMAMDIATGGTIDGDTVTFAGDEAERDWTLCEGPVAGETSAEAQCDDDDATITMEFDAERALTGDPAR